MLATSRMKRSAVAVGREVDLLGDVGAVEAHRVGAVLALDVSLPSPGSQTKVSSPAPMSAMSLPPLPSIESLPSPPSSVSTPWPPASVSLPAPPSMVRAIALGGERGGVDRVVAAEAVDGELVGRLLAAVIAHRARPGPETATPDGVAADGDRVVAVGAVDDHAVGWPSPLPPAAGEVER